MFRTFIGYICGLISGMFLISAFIVGRNILIVAIILAIVALVSCILIAHFHHKRKRKEYYDKIKGGSKNKYLRNYPLTHL